MNSADGHADEQCRCTVPMNLRMPILMPEANPSLSSSQPAGLVGLGCLSATFYCRGAGDLPREAHPWCLHFISGEAFNRTFDEQCR